MIRNAFYDSIPAVEPGFDMRKIVTGTFVTLDGVMQAPGGPEEDREGGFAQGGWSFGYWDQMMGDVMGKMMKSPFELLLGKKTYDIFAAYWPNAKSDLDVKEKFNSTRKYVVSKRPVKLSWQNSTLVTGDVVKEIKRLKAMDGPDLLVQGSGKLIQTLLAHDLIDTMHVWTFPVTVGAGKRLFAEGTRAEGLKLVNSQISTTGVVMATYEKAGEIKKGSFPD
jgi:dihydrofolate reductase